jgi:DNA-binding MarR family transcriptional regulator
MGPPKLGGIDKDKIVGAAEALERRTKAKGRVNGALGQPTLSVLRAMVRRTNAGTGLCRATYADLERETGCCKQTITNALRRLEAAGIVSREPNGVGVK